MFNTQQAVIVCKGLANARRVLLLNMLDAKSPESISQLARRLRINQPAATVHVRKLIEAGLVISRRIGVKAEVRLTPRGRTVLKMLRKLG